MIARDLTTVDDAYLAGLIDGCALAVETIPPDVVHLWTDALAERLHACAAEVARRLGVAGTVAP